jgi:hypothetical protein
MVFALLARELVDDRLVDPVPVALRHHQEVEVVGLPSASAKLT